MTSYLNSVIKFGRQYFDLLVELTVFLLLEISKENDNK